MLLFLFKAPIIIMFTRKRSISRVRVLPPGNPTNNYPPWLQLPRSLHGARSRRRGVTIPRRVTQLGPQYGEYSRGRRQGVIVTPSCQLGIFHFFHFRHAPVSSRSR